MVLAAERRWMLARGGAKPKASETPGTHAKFKEAPAGRRNPRCSMPQSYVCLHYHLVFSTKNRIPAIVPEMETRLWEYLGGIVRDLGGTPIQIGGVEDHVHLLVTLRQELALKDVLRELKASSSGWVHREFPNIHDFWWQTGYGAFTVSHSNIDAVKAYILNQKEHHKKQSFTDEFRALLQKHEIEFKDEYLF
jgi:putative transposase